MNCSSLSTGNTHWLAFFSSTFARGVEGDIVFLGSHVVDQFFIIKTDVQVFCQSLADEAPVASNIRLIVIIRFAIMNTSFIQAGSRKVCFPAFKRQWC